MFLRKGKEKMTEKLKLALEKYSQDEALQAEVEKNPPKTAEDIIAIAARVGVELAEEDLDFVKEIPLGDADQIAGGRSKRDIKKECGGNAYAWCIIGAGVGYWDPSKKK